MVFFPHLVLGKEIMFGKPFLLAEGLDEDLPFLYMTWAGTLDEFLASPNHWLPLSYSYTVHSLHVWQTNSLRNDSNIL